MKHFYYLFKLAFSAIFIGSPFLLIQIYKFIAPGLYKKMKKNLITLLNINTNSFLFGGMLVYYLVMPLAIKFFYHLSQWDLIQICLFN